VGSAPPRPAGGVEPTFPLVAGGAGASLPLDPVTGTKLDLPVAAEIVTSGTSVVVIAAF